jgi:hypothetical protein
VKIDPIALGNTAAQILVIRSIIRALAVALGRTPAELTEQIALDVAPRIDALTLPPPHDPDALRTAARQMLNKITEGVA